VLEVVLGLAFLRFSRRRWPWLATIAIMIAASVGVIATAPARALAPFNPVTLNLLLAVVAAIGLLSLRDLPSARRTLRAPPKRIARPTPTTETAP
jgi:peptidoglycan/LPS O-acetylase OafA/YrhL